MAILIGAMPLVAGAALRPVKLTCEDRSNPSAVDIGRPRLSWVNQPGERDRGEAQSAWEIRVSGSREGLLAGRDLLWSSGKVHSSNSLNIPYGGSPLFSRQECWWQVRVWNRKGKASGWSEPAFWGMGLLDAADWKGVWIGAPWQGEDPLPRSPHRGPANGGFKHRPADQMPPPAPLLRKSFTLEKELRSAKAYVTGLGFFELYINGQKVSDDVMAPALSLYGPRKSAGDIGIMTGNNFSEYRVFYLCYDISSLVRKGANAAGVILGNGFYNPASSWCEGYGTPRFLGQIHLTYADGTEEVIASGPDWKASKSPILLDNVYDGEHYDARLEQPGWCEAGFNDSGWEKVAIRKAPGGKLQAQLAPGDRVMERLQPVRTEKLGEGHYLVDFGEEISGWIRINRVEGEAGRRIDLKYRCESAMGDNSYTLRGGGRESYAARFTWFVFSEAEIINWPGELQPGDITAEAVYSEVPTSGHFTSSDTLINKIHRIWRRSQTDNMHGSVASDCPHRERSPYTGDGQVACVTVMHNFDARAFYTKWIGDMRGARNEENGYVPNGAPWQPGCGGGPAWGAAICIMPWEYYTHYGDTTILRDNYEAMKGYVGYMLTWTNAEGIMHSQAPDPAHPNPWINLGDWVAPGELPPADMVHTFFLWRCAALTSQSARVLGKAVEADKYQQLADRTKEAFHRKFYNAEKGSYGPYGGNIFALKIGIPEERKARVLEALREDIARNGGHLDTGIFGTQFFFEVLSENGMHDLAWEAMKKTTQPSFGWWISQGATTTWEQWDGGNSRNHPMFGGGIVWFYRTLAGLSADPAAPGYRNIIFRPQPAGDLNQSAYSLETPYGLAASSWTRDKEGFRMEVTVPVGAEGKVYVPLGADHKVDIPLERSASRKPSVKSSGKPRFEGIKGEYAVYRVGQGKYSFSVRPAL
jgi:alpha-L-rhamnosidase